MAAERDANDRYVAAYLQGHEGAEFEGRITGVTRFGLFVRLIETGADGLVPVSSLGDEYFIHDDRAHALVGERSGKRYPLGLRVDVRLREATPVTGGLLLEMLTEAQPGSPARPAPGSAPAAVARPPASAAGPGGEAAISSPCGAWEVARRAGGAGGAARERGTDTP
jgi:ribonuclease R